MNVKKRNIYEVNYNVVTEWDEETGMPTDADPVISMGDVEFPYTTANALRAYDFYLKTADLLADEDEVELIAIEIVVSDEAWADLLEKETLDYDDYKDYLEDEHYEGLAWRSSRDGDDIPVIDELLITQSEYFNMRAVCQRAKISYSTYRGYKNNKQPFSLMKKYALLKQMSEIGNACWDSMLDFRFVNLSNRKQR